MCPVLILLLVVDHGRQGCAYRGGVFWGAENLLKMGMSGVSYLKAGHSIPSQCDLGRFISRDPIGFAGGLNLFNGAATSPVTLVDPAGLVPLWGPWDSKYLNGKARYVWDKTVETAKSGKDVYKEVAQRMGGEGTRGKAALDTLKTRGLRFPGGQALGGTEAGATTTGLLARLGLGAITGVGAYASVANIRCQNAIENFLAKEIAIREGVCPGRLKEAQIQDLLHETDEYVTMWVECNSPGVFKGASDYARSR